MKYYKVFFILLAFFACTSVNQAQAQTTIDVSNNSLNTFNVAMSLRAYTSPSCTSTISATCLAGVVNHNGGVATTYSIPCNTATPPDKILTLRVCETSNPANCGVISSEPGCGPTSASFVTSYGGATVSYDQATNTLSIQ